MEYPLAVPFGVSTLKSPLIRIWPLDCGTIRLTLPFALGLNGPSTDPSELRRAIKFREIPSIEVKFPPTSRCPSDWSTSVCTLPFSVGAKVRSRVPSAFKRAR